VVANISPLEAFTADHMSYMSVNIPSASVVNGVVKLPLIHPLVTLRYASLRPDDMVSVIDRDDLDQPVKSLGCV